MFRMRVNKATIGQWSAKYIAGMRAARSLEWRCLWSCMGTMAWCAADFRATQPRQLGAARSDFGPGTARRPPDRQEMQRHRARALCDHRRPCWQRSGRSCRASPEPLPLGPAAAANAPLPGMPSAPGRALCAAITAAHTFTIAELFVRLGTALAAAGGRRRSSAGVQQSPAGLQEDVRPQVHQLASSGALERAPQMHMSSAETPRHLRPSWPRPPLTSALDASSRRSKICSLSSI